MESPKDQYACTWIYVEVDLKAGLPEAIKLTIGTWYHYQKLDYEQLSSKCKGCHEYGHFLCKCPKKQETQQEDEDGWQAVKKIKLNQKGGKPPRNEMKKNVPRKTSTEPNPALQKDNGNSFGTLLIIEETNINENKE